MSAAMATISGIPVHRKYAAAPLPAGDEELQLVIVGGGPVGLTLALDLGRRGHRVTLLNAIDFVAAGSKGICYSKRTLDIWNALGVGTAMVTRGVIWNIGKVFWGSRPTPVFEFDMLPVKDQAMPGFINLQQYHVEEILIAALAALPNVDIRWGHKVTHVESQGESVLTTVEPSGNSYAITADWLIACDGSHSTVRQTLGLDFEGKVFEDNFLIADIKLKQPLPAERRFWFDPPFNPGQSALMHKQPDDIWRLDFQLGWGIDRAACIKPENVAPLVRGMLGEDVEFEPVWYSVYTFGCRRMASFVHARVIFAGDSAHLVSPFGARGANGGIADAANLGWKLDAIVRSQAKPELLASYDHEATVTADANILASSRSTDFLTPKSPAARAFRDAVLELAVDHPFARPFVNSGRLSTAIPYPSSPLNTADEPDAHWSGIMPGAPALDAPAGQGWLLDELGDGFTLLSNGWSGPALPGLKLIDIADRLEQLDLLVARYDLQQGSAYLIRPDQYVAGRWRFPTSDGVCAALDCARGGSC
jgi:3-(3-hydroxy-phenyl)propionate hydroxylase